MKLFIHHSNNNAEEVSLFFSGWGMDERPFLEYVPVNKDFIVCYDYSSLNDLESGLLYSYKSIRVIAWSMGVWAASQVLQEHALPITEAVAVNGTPCPVSDLFGIPAAVFRGTLNNLDERNLYKFRRRMCGTPEQLKCFLDIPPNRTLEDLKSELHSIGEQAVTIPLSTFRWDRAYIGIHDKIFPPQNQMRAWQETPIVEVDEEHLPGQKLWRELL